MYSECNWLPVLEETFQKPPCEVCAWMVTGLLWLKYLNAINGIENPCLQGFQLLECLVGPLFSVRCVLVTYAVILYGVMH